MRKTKKDWETHIRQCVEKRIKRELPDDVWAYMRDVQSFEMDDGHPSEAEKVDTLVTEYRKLCDIAHDLFSCGAVSPLTRPRQPREETHVTHVMEHVVAEPSSEEKLRAEVVSPYIGKVAGAHPDVVKFRNEVLHGQLLETYDAYELMTSLAANCLSPDEFVRRGIPIVGHHVEDAVFTVLSGGDILKLRMTLHISGLDQPLTVTSPPYLPHCGWVTDDPDVALQEMPDETPVPPRMMFMWPGSVIDQLNTASGYLVEAFGWDETAARIFVLTGECPNLRPVVAQHFDYTWDCYKHSRIFISAEPWITTKTLVNNFLKVQRRVLGRRNRRLGERQLRLFQFVWSIENELPRRGKWKIVLEKWNEWCLKNDEKEGRCEQDEQKRRREQDKKKRRCEQDEKKRRCEQDEKKRRCEQDKEKWRYDDVDHIISDYNRTAKALLGGRT